MGRRVEPLGTVEHGIRPMVVGESGTRQQRAAAARWRATTTVQPGTAGNPHGRPLSYLAGLVAGFVGRVLNGDPLVNDASMAGAHVSTQTAAPYAGRVYPTRSSDDGQAPAVEE